jgi:hypothetical protein
LFQWEFDEIHSFAQGLPRLDGNLFCEERAKKLETGGELQFIAVSVAHSPNAIVTTILFAVL